jgi:hypothetical protein
MDSISAMDQEHMSQRPGSVDTDSFEAFATSILHAAQADEQNGDHVGIQIVVPVPDHDSLNALEAHYTTEPRAEFDQRELPDSILFVAALSLPPDHPSRIEAEARAAEDLDKARARASAAGQDPNQVTVLVESCLEFRVLLWETLILLNSTRARQDAVLYLYRSPGAYGLGTKTRRSGRFTQDF